MDISAEFLLVRDAPITFDEFQASPITSYRNQEICPISRPLLFLKCDHGHGEDVIGEVILPLHTFHL